MYLNDFLNDYSSIPSKKDEKWRFSPLRKFLNSEYKELNHTQKDSFSSCPNEFYLHVEDGNIFTHHLPMSVHIKKREFHHDEAINPFASLAQKFSKKSVELYFHENTKINIYLHFSQGFLCFSSLNLILHESVKVEVYFHFTGGQDSFISHSCFVKTFENSKLNITQNFDFDKKAVFISQNSFHLEENAKVKSFYLLNSSLYIHNFIKADLHYKSSFDLSSILKSKDSDHLILSCDVNHLSSYSSSSVLSKQVLKDNSTCVFDANSLILKDTKKCEVLQSSKALVLSEKAQIHSKPHLEIYSDDLKASHGCTVGQLDKDAISFLLARGIQEIKAKEILVDTFVQEVFESLENEEHKKKLLGEDNV